MYVEVACWHVLAPNPEMAGATDGLTHQLVMMSQREERRTADRLSQVRDPIG